MHNDKFIRRTLDETCMKCEERLKTEALGDLIPIGRPVLIETSEPVMRTEYKYYQCPTCGGIWCRVIDSGFGGHDSHIYRVPLDFFIFQVKPGSSGAL